MLTDLTRYVNLRYGVDNEGNTVIGPQRPNASVNPAPDTKGGHHSGYFTGSDEEIHTFCTGRFAITFPQFAKADMRGETAIPLFRYLAENTKFEGFGLSPMGVMMSGIAKKMDKDYKKNGEVKWNFTKFLIGKDGQIVARFEPTEDMKNVAKKVRELL